MLLLFLDPIFSQSFAIVTYCIRRFKDHILQLYWPAASYMNLSVAVYHAVDLLSTDMWFIDQQEYLPIACILFSWEG